MSSFGQEADEARLRSRKLVRLAFSIHLPTWVLAEAFAQLPDDTMIVRCGYEDLQYARSCLILWSRQFDSTPQSQMLPDIMIEVTRQEDGSETIRLMRTNSRNEWVPCRFV